MNDGFNPTEMEELVKALKRRDRFTVDQWLAERTDRRLLWLDDVTFEKWAARAQFWSSPELAEDVKKVITKST